MKKTLLTMLLACISVAAHADWTRMTHGATDFVLYVDHETRQDTGGGTVKLWHLVDYAAEQDLNGRPFRSIKAHDEYDCSRGMRRDIMHVWHADNMAGGMMLKAAYKPGPWSAPTESSIEQTLMRLVCTPKK